jgi:hypothetical protein
MEGKISRFRKTRLFCRSFTLSGIGMTAGELFLKSKKIAAPKKNSTFADGFLFFLLLKT